MQSGSRSREAHRFPAIVRRCETAAAGRPALLRCAWAVALLPAFAAFAAEPRRPLETGTVEVVADSPLPGLGVARDEVPANVQAIGDDALERRRSLNLPDLLTERLNGVNANQIAGNPYQVDLNYRGFTASPLLGTPQGISVYLDGMRLNEPFGEVVNWDLLPENAIAGVNLLPGAHPVYGLNTLGGALALRSKSGETFPGASAQFGAGSFGRLQAQAEFGAARGPLGVFLAANASQDDGWRDFSPSRLNQVFAKFGHETLDSDVDLALMAADSRLTGNQLTPGDLLAQRREAVYTHPDEVDNLAWAANLNASRDLGDGLSLALNFHHRRSRSEARNPDVNEVEDARFGVVPYQDDPDPQRAASLNRSDLRQHATGLSLQATWQPRETQRFTAGFAYSRGESSYRRSYQLGSFGASRDVIPLGTPVEHVSIDGSTRNAGVFAAWHWQPSERWKLSASARYDRTQVITRDFLTPPLPDAQDPAVALRLDNDFTYHHLNPALGVTFTPDPRVTLYAGAGEGSRAPSPIELACADRNNPCLLPNAMQSDPFLKQVVTRSFEAGVRGRQGDALRWQLALYRADNRDDILFVAAGASRGYFANFGRTRRQGLEASLTGAWSSIEWSVGYALVDATYQSPVVIVSPNNSSRGTAPGTGPDEILVSPGDRIPNIPRHQLKLATRWQAAPRLAVDLSMLAFSTQYVRGNENNQHQAETVNGDTFHGAGSIPGYAVFNFGASWRFDRSWELIGRVDNLFDRSYATAGQLGESAFPGGSFQPDPDQWRLDTFVAPGAPRTIWLGIRFAMDDK